MFSQFKISEGCPYPLGATPDDKGVNFAIFSANADRVELCLFDPQGRTEIQRIPLENMTDHVWHVRVEGLEVKAVYAYRVYGAYEPHNGHRFNENKLLIDPYAKQMLGNFRWSSDVFGYDIASPDQDLTKCTIDNARDAIKSVVVDDSLCYSTQSTPPGVPWQKTIIYEMHVKGFTQLNMALDTRDRGTFAGLAQTEVLGYIKSLGVTAIELLPIHSFIDEQFLIDHGLTNYWGYNSVNFFSPHASYLSSGDRQEFLHFVNAAHDHGLEVILDVVYNHTAEGNHLGPTLSFRGIDNASYYALEAHDARFYANDTGCGNTLNVKHPRVLQMVMDSLRYWVSTYGVDGFRFDLASVLGREHAGFDSGSGFFDAIRQDPVLARCKMIAEPWDIGPGGYQLGNYPLGWAEWNDRYRDTVRKYWRGDADILPEFARRIHGSSDLFEHSGRSPCATINYVASHDGFTLADLVSYKNRHNLENKESNNDGHHANFSDNYGEEGETKNKKIVKLRERQARNFIATLFLSQGTPMLLAGDEFGRTQRGNNNAYCQDNDINWIDWHTVSAAETHLLQFTQYVISLRKKYPVFTSKFYIHKPIQPDNESLGSVRWFGVSGEEMGERDWGEQNASVLGCLLENYVLSSDNTKKRCTVLLLFNSSREKQSFVLPKHQGVSVWRCILDTSEGNGVPEQDLLSIKDKISMLEKAMCVFTAAFD